MANSCLVIAHRGASADTTENSLEAFRRARSSGADAVELDVHATADGAFVVHHDPVVAGRRIAECPADDLAGVQLPNGEPLPLLADALAAIGPGLEVFVEVKTLDAQHDASFLAVLEAGPAAARSHVHGFDHRIVRRLKARRANLVCGILSTAYPVRPMVPVQDAGASELWQERSLLDGALVELAHAAGVRVYAWTVDDVPTMRHLRDLGVDGICTNHPASAREVTG